VLRLFRVGIGIGALVALMGFGAAKMLYRSGTFLSEARRWAALDSREARRLTFGADYSDAIETLRRTLPSDAWYLLVPPRETAATGWEQWVRYDLAPRRPILIQTRGGHRVRGPSGEAVPAWVRWAVLPDENGTPRLVPRKELRAELRALDDRR
jgi:hypothetical protein